MIVNLKELSNVVSQISDLVAGDKTIPGILFNIRDNDIEVCYSDAYKIFSETVPAEITEDDVKGKIVFNYQALTRIIEACKPTGKIITNTVEFTFCDNKVVKIEAEKKIPIITVDPDTGDEISAEKLVSVTEQSVSWAPADGGVRVAVLGRENYELMNHYPEDEVAERFPDESKPRPKTNEEWEMENDSWDIAELRNILAKLSIESGKIVYVAPSTQKAFVQNTSCVICIPVKSEIKHKIIQSTSMAKAMSTVLGKINTEDGTIHTHMIDNDRVVYSTEDNSVAISIKNLKQDNSNILQLNNCLSKDYSQYMLNFNREVLQSCLYGAKTAGASEKAVITFEPFTETVVVNGEEVEISKVKLVMSAKNTNSSTDNKYDVIADYVLDASESIGSLKLNVTLDILHQAVSRAETDYVAFDIHVDPNNTKMVRIAEIDLEKRAEISSKYEISGGWTPEFTAEHRAEMLGYTTYFSVSAE